MEPTHPQTQEMEPVHPEQKPTPTSPETTPEYKTPHLKWVLAAIGAVIALWFLSLILISTFEPNLAKTLSYTCFLIAAALPTTWFVIHENRARNNIQPPLERYWHIIWGIVGAFILFGLGLYPGLPSWAHNDDHPYSTPKTSEEKPAPDTHQHPSPQAPLTTKTEPGFNPNDIPQPDFNNTAPDYTPDQWGEPAFNYHPDPDSADPEPHVDRNNEPQHPVEKDNSHQPPQANNTGSKPYYTAPNPAPATPESNPATSLPQNTPATDDAGTMDTDNMGAENLDGEE